MQHLSIQLLISIFPRKELIKSQSKNRVLIHTPRLGNNIIPVPLLRLSGITINRLSSYCLSEHIISWSHLNVAAQVSPLNTSSGAEQPQIRHVMAGSSNATSLHLHRFCHTLVHGGNSILHAVTLLTLETLTGIVKELSSYATSH